MFSERILEAPSLRTWFWRWNPGKPSGGPDGARSSVTWARDSFVFRACHRLLLPYGPIPSHLFKTDPLVQAGMRALRPRPTTCVDGRNLVCHHAWPTCLSALYFLFSSPSLEACGTVRPCWRSSVLRPLLRTLQRPAHLFQASFSAPRFSSKGAFVALATDS